MHVHAACTHKPSDYLTSLQVGVISGQDPLLSLQTSMQSVIAPVIFNSSSWPDTIRKDLHAATHKFMSVLVQCAVSYTHLTLPTTPYV